jgi:putative transposase
MIKNEYDTNPKIENPFSWVSGLGKIEKTASHACYYSKFDLRDLTVPSPVNSSRPWILETPSAIRARAAFELHDRYKTCLENLKNKNIKFFDMKFKTKKSIRWTMNIPKENLFLPRSDTCKCHQIKNCQGVVLEENVSQKECSTCKFLPLNQFKLYQESGWIKTTEPLNESITLMDSKIHFDGIHYYILIPYTKPTLKKTPNSNWFCSLDPGSRKFQTVYSPDANCVINIGTDASTKMHQHLIHLDRVISKNSKNEKKKYKIQKIKLLNKIQNLQKELRNKTSRFLCDNFNNILVPKLTKNNDIINKKKRKINSKTVRKMVVLGHSKFVELLKTKADEYENVNVSVITEEFTSQTCLKCKKRTKMSGEIYKCKSCHFTCDRDTLGSINILLKNWDLMH